MPSVNSDRLYASLTELGRIGAYHDERSGLQGVNRLALTAAEGQGREWVCEQMRERGLKVRVDRVGNVYGRRAGCEDALAPVVIGSHIDTVATAGRFDGCLGVLAGLEVVSALNDAEASTQRPLEVAFFTEEEGARFGTDMVGSAVATGRIALEDAHALTDRDGVRLDDALRGIGFLGETSELVAPPRVFLELHIEQGPLLARGGHSVGVVTGVQAISWQELVILGRSAHAGTTPMNLRADAALAAACVVCELRRMTQDERFGDLRTTCGSQRLSPGLINVIASRAVLTADLRNLREDDMRAAEEHLASFLRDLAEREGVAIEATQTARTPPVEFDTRLRARLSALAEARGFPATEIVSGAGHDAQEFARIGPAAMIFVPGNHDGISHNPREHSTPEQCSTGATLLLDLALELLSEKE